MIVRLALRSLTTRPLRSAVLAAGFGLGIGVMVELLGVGQVILEQAHAPALQGGGDVVIGGSFTPLGSARFLLSYVLGSAPFGEQIVAASPNRRATVFLIKPGVTIPVSMQGGVPSLEKAIGDPEVAAQPAWRDEAADTAWTSPAPGDLLRAMDRFHPIPRVEQPSPEQESLPVARGSAPAPKAPTRNSWAEWLYFNGRTSDGQLRFYLSFIAGVRDSGSGRRTIAARLQLDRSGQSTNYSAIADVDDGDLIARAPDIDVGDNHVRLEGTRYRITLVLNAESSDATDRAAAQAARRVAPVPPGAERARPVRRPALTGELILDAIPGRSLPPATIHGAHGWMSGYVVPVLAGTFNGTLRVGSETIAIENASGYHDHNWGFWEGVRWQWGQVASGDLSIVFGRVFPPPAVADPDRIPGFLGLLGPDGPIGFSTDVSIAEEAGRGSPRAMHVRATGQGMDLTLTFTVAEHVRTAAFLQLGGVYQVRGRAGDRDIAFSARGSAETFRIQN